MDPFLAKLVIGFVAGGVWISATTLIAERLGTKVGGLVAGLPSTVVLSMFFIGWTQGPQQAYQSTTAFPAAFSVLSLFLLISAVTISHGIARALIISFSVWLALESIIILWHPSNYALTSLIWLVLFLLTAWAMWSLLQLKPLPGRKPVSSFNQMTVRSIFSGAVIVMSVVASKLGGPVWGSVFSGFPAVFTASLVITYYSSGPEFSRSMTLPMLVSAMVNCMVFVTILRYAVQSLGILYACLAGYLASFISAYLTWKFILARWE